MSTTQVPSDFLLFSDHGDGVLRELLPGGYRVLPEAYHPHARVLLPAGLITKPSAVRPAVSLRNSLVTAISSRRSSCARAHKPPLAGAHSPTLALIWTALQYNELDGHASLQLLVRPNSAAIDSDAIHESESSSLTRVKCRSPTGNDSGVHRGVHAEARGRHGEPRRIARPGRPSGAAHQGRLPRCAPLAEGLALHGQVRAPRRLLPMRLMCFDEVIGLLCWAQTLGWRHNLDGEKELRMMLAPSRPAREDVSYRCVALCQSYCKWHTFSAVKTCRWLSYSPVAMLAKVRTGRRFIPTHKLGLPRSIGAVASPPLTTLAGSASSKHAALVASVLPLTEDDTDSLRVALGDNGSIPIDVVVREAMLLFVGQGKG